MIIAVCFFIGRSPCKPNYIHLGNFVKKFTLLFTLPKPYKVLDNLNGMDIIKLNYKERSRMTPDEKNKIVIVNKVKQYCDRLPIDRSEFIGRCLQSRKTFRGRRLTADTAGRIYDGETGIVLGTAGLVAAALGVTISEIFEIK